MVCADHELGAATASCNTYNGTNGDETYTGTAACDIFNMYAGKDGAFGGDCPPGTFDELHMGAGTDGGHGEACEDMVFGGDNPTDSREDMFGGAGLDDIEDLTGPDWDYLCGGDNTDNPVDARDGDNRDLVKGGPNDYTHEDSVYGDPNDTVYKDGDCTP